MHDFFEPPHRGRVVYHACGKPGAIDLSISSGSGELGLDRRYRLTLVELMDSRVRVINGYAGLFEQLCCGRFAHSNRAGQSENQHGLKIQSVSHDAGTPAAAIAEDPIW